MLECMEILALATQKGIRVYAVKGSWQLDGSMQSKIMALAFAMAAEIEHDLLSQRTKEALRARKSAGITLGRPKGPGKSKLDAYQLDIKTLLDHGATQKYIARHYHVTEATVSRWRKKRGV
jgi:DNA invertase Pin-like site-specific DNA recombinase